LVLPRAAEIEAFMTSKPVICLGCAFWDSIFKIDEIPGRGTKVLPETAVQAGSGMATAAAATVARLGGAVELWTRIGDDATGDSFVADVAREGVRHDRIRRLSGCRTPFSSILVDRRGERLVVPFTDPGLDPDPGWLPLDEVRLAGAVLADVRWVEGARAILGRARQDGVPSVLDADIAPPAILVELAGMADHVLFSEPALAAVSGGSAPRDALLGIAVGTGAAAVGVTLGEAGAMVRFRGDEPGIVRHFQGVRVAAVDTLNAGDVWHGTYAHGLAAGWDLPLTIRRANLAAAMKCEHFGGRLGAPTLDELLSREDAERVSGRSSRIPIT
jgi:sulfofructose kinase